MTPSSNIWRTISEGTGFTAVWKKQNEHYNVHYKVAMNATGTNYIVSRLVLDLEATLLRNDDD